MKINIIYGPGSRLKPQDFSRGDYECMEVFSGRDGQPVIVSRNKQTSSFRWKVEHLTSCMVFQSKREAMLCAKSLR